MHEAFEIESKPVGDGAVAVIWLEQGDRPVVVLDGDLLERLDTTLDALNGRAWAGVVLASRAPKAFVAGADLKSIMAMSDTELDAYLARGQAVFGRLSQLPCPTAAAIHGATLGGGLELAMHCDWLVAAPRADGKPYPIGLPEAGLKICPGWGGTNMLPARMDAAEAIRRTAAGEAMTVSEAIEADLVIESTPETLIDDAIRAIDVADCPERDGAPSAWIGRDECRADVSGALDAFEAATGPAQAVAACVRAGLDRGWAAALDEERAKLIERRNTDEAKEAIGAFFARSGKPAKA